MTIMKTSPRCLVAGSVNIDEFYTLPHIVRPGETISSTGFHRRGGGKGGNQAVSVARASSSKGAVKLEASIGADGQELLPFMTEAGVDVSGVEVVKEHTGRAIIQLSANGENSIVLFPGANHVRYPSEGACAGMTHLMVQNEIPKDATLQYLDMARAGGLTTIFNPSPMPTRDELRVFPWGTIDWLLLNEGEAGDIAAAFDVAEGEVGDAIDPSLPQDARTALAILGRLRQLPQFAAVNFLCTLGPVGVVLCLPGQKAIFRPAARLLNPLKDTTGAGDCFAGYFVAGLMRGDDLVKVVDECLVACSICVENPGAAESVPVRAAVLERLAQL